MKAVRYYGKNDVRIVEIDKPKPKAGEILLKMGGAGVCHSDLHLIHEDSPFPTPFTLGHENAGWIEELGEGVSGFKKGEAVAVYGPWGCGHCHACQESKENYCENQAELGLLGGGLGHNGGMAEYMIVPNARLLVPLGEGLHPAKAAPLTDAALTPYHAIKSSLPKLTPSTFVTVIGIGGLGHMALQILKALCSATIIACDSVDEKLTLAKEVGADYTFNSTDPDVAKKILKITGNKKCGVVFDFVGIKPTVALGKQIVGLDSDWTIVGLGGAVVDYGSPGTPFGCSLTTPYWGSRAELMEVLDLARNGHIHLHTEEHPLSDALEVYKRLDEGKINGRAVLIP